MNPLRFHPYPLLAFLVMACFMIPGVKGQEKMNEAKPNSVEDLIVEVLGNNPELQAAEADVVAARGQRTQAGLWKNPDISAQYGERRVATADGSLAKGFTETITMTQTFEFPGKGSLRKAIANRDVELAELGLQQFRATLMGRVKLLAWRYAVESANAKTAQIISDRNETLIELLRKRPRAGIQAYLDAHNLEGSLVELQQSVRESEQIRLSTLIELNVLRGQPTTTPINISVSNTAVDQKLDLPNLVARGLDQNLLLKIRSAELQRAQSENQASWLAAAPDFTVGPFYSLDKAGDHDEKVGFSVTLPLPLWNGNQGNIQSSKARENKADALKQQARREMEAAISRLFDSYALMQKQIEKTPIEFLAHMEEAADLADRHYRLGAVTLQTFLEAQRQLLSAGKLQRQSILDAEAILLDLELQTQSPLTNPPFTKFVKPITDQ